MLNFADSGIGRKQRKFSVNHAGNKSVAFSHSHRSTHFGRDDYPSACADLKPVFQPRCTGVRS